MTGTLIAEKVKIAAFRGITEPLELDFTAPVTLVYAPNGTGKTTFCEAIEWLLTGQVERLRDGKWSSDILKSVFLDDATPEVEAELQIGGQKHHMWRTPDGVWIDKRTGDPRRPGDVLEMLAPTAAAPNRHHISAISLRQHYLRGTRFLTSEALAALVDNSQDSLDRRKDVFADLLGIRHLRDAEQASGRYVAELAPFLRDLEARRRNLSNEASLLRGELKDSQTAAKSADASLTAAETHLGLKPAGTDIPTRLQAVAGAIAKGRHDQARRFEALDQLGPVWSRKRELDSQISVLGSSEAQAVAALEVAQTERKQSEEASRDREGAEQMAAAALGRLEAAESFLRTKLDAVVLAAAHAEPYLSGGQATLTSLVAAAPEMRWDDAGREVRRSGVREATDAEPRVDQILEEQAKLSAQRAEHQSRLPSTEDVQALRTAVEQHDNAAARAQADAEALVGPVATLQSAGRTVVDHQHENDTDCPLCGFDWKERSRLLDAVQRTLDAAPAIVAAARSLATNAASAATAARKALSDANQLRAQAENFDREARALETRLDADRKLLQAIDAPLSGDERRRALDWAERRLDLAQALAELSATQTAHLASVSDSASRFLDSNLPIGQLATLLGRTFATRRRELDERLTLARRSLNTARQDVADKVAKEKLQQETLEAVRRDKAAAERELASIIRLWTTAAGRREWTIDGLERLRSEVRTALAKIDEADSEFASARAAWNVETKHARLTRIGAELAPINAKFARLKASSDTAEGLRSAFRDSYIATSQAQVGGLSRVVNALFLRMHANRIVDRIDLGQSDAFLHWFADAGTAQLDPGRDFSQGQRQDLALALFLARARGLGGTFFLDEPVAHLDDLNRVGLMDVFRAVATEGADRIRLVITTASRSLARHMVEKFAAVGSSDAKEPAMRVIELTGNGRLGVSKEQVYPIGA